MKAEEYEQIRKAVDNTHIEIVLTDNSTFLKRVPTTTHEKLALRLALKTRFSDIFKNPTLDKLEREYLTLKTKLDKEKALKERKAREEWLKQQKEPLNWFLRILRNNWHLVNPDELDAWLAETTVEQRSKVLQEFKKMSKVRGLGFPQTTVEFGLAFLQSSLKTESQEGKKWKKKKFLKLFTKA